MINKDLNTNLQLTIKKESFNKLEKIKKDLSKKLNISLTKSQTIEYLINDFEESKPKPTTPKNKGVEKPNQNTKLKKKSDNLTFIDKDFLYEKLRVLRAKLNTTNKGLSIILNIPISTIEKYLKGYRNATGENAEKILKAFKDNDIN